MLYISEDELFAVMSDRDLFDLTDNLEPAAKSALLESVNEDAVGLIHGYLRGRYTLPVAAPDSFLKGIVKDITKYLLYKRRDILNVPESLLKQYASTIGMLKDIQKGVMILDAPLIGTGDTESDNEGGGSVLFANRPTTPTGIFLHNQ